MASPHQDKGLLSIFNRLRHAHESVRVAAAEDILQQVLTSGDAATWPYCLQRLVRGLASNNDTARKGFFVTLVELLRQSGRPNLLQEVKDTLQQSLNHKGSKSEEGDYLCGQMLCHGALLRCGRFSAPECAETAKVLLNVATKRSYLLIPAFEFIADYIKAMESSSDFTAHVWPVLRDGIDWRSGQLTLEQLYLLLVINQSFPETLNKVFMSANFGRKKLIGKEFLASVAKAREEVTIPIHIMKKHPFFPALFSTLKKEKLLEQFWKEHIDPTINVNSSYKTIQAFSLLELILEHDVADPKSLNPFLTPNVVRTSVAFLSRAESNEAEDGMIVEVLGKLVSLTVKCPQTQDQVLKSLLNYPGNIAFDKVTGGNVISRLMALASRETVESVGQFYRQAVVGHPDETGHERTVQDRIYAAQQLAKLVTHPVVQDDSDWKAETIKFLLTTTLFQVKKPVEPLHGVPQPFSREARVQVKEAFFKTLDFKAKNFDSVCLVLKRAADHANDLLQHPKKAEPLQEWSKETKTAWATMLKDVEALEKRAKPRKEDKVFQLLYLHMGFQLFSDPAMACETLVDLKNCQQRAAKKQKSSDGDPYWVEVVIDLLLFLLSHNKHVLRQVVKSVIVLLCPHITAEALQAVMDVVNPTKKDEEMEESEEEEEEEEEDDDDDEGSEDKEEKEDGEESEEDSDDEDENEDGDKTLDEGFVGRVKNALGEYAAETDEESVDIDMDDIPEEDMKKMDEALAGVFRMLSKGKKGSHQLRKEKKDEMESLHFKLRALDIIDVYLAHQPALSHVLAVIDFVFTTLHDMPKSKANQPLETRLKGTLKKIMFLKKAQQVRVDEDFDPEAGVQLLQKLVDLANKGSPLVAQLSNPTPVFSQCCLLVIKVSQQLKSSQVAGKVLSVFQEALNGFFHKSICVLPVSFFQLPMESNWTDSWSLVPKLVSGGFDPQTRLFRRVQALTLLASVFSNPNLRASAPAPAPELARDLQAKIAAELRASDKLKPRYLSELLNLLVALHHGQVPLDWEAVKVELEDFRARVPKGRHFHDVKKPFNKIGTLLKIQVVQASEKELAKKQQQQNGTNDGESPAKKKAQKKQKPKSDFFAGLVNGEVGEGKEQENSNSEESDDESEVGAKDEATETVTKAEKKKKKKKRKHSKEGLQERKKAKYHNVDGQFAGLEMPSFSGIAISDNMNFAHASKVESSEKKEKPSEINGGRTKKAIKKKKRKSK